jgi:hypothetical protein
MSWPGNPYDNAWAESFMKTRKAEEVDGRRYRNLDEAASSIRSFLEESTTSSGSIRRWIIVHR